MTEQKLSVRLQTCKSLDDVVNAFVGIGLKKAHRLSSSGYALAITSSGSDFLNIVAVDQLPSSIQPPEKRANVRFALYVDSTFSSYKFFDVYAKTGLGISYSFTASTLADGSINNIATKKLDDVAFNNLDSFRAVVGTTIEEAIQNFEQNLKVVIDSLRAEIDDKISKNKNLQLALDDTVSTFSGFIGSEFKKNALIELLIQHLLTKDIFTAAFGQGFHHGNNVAKCLDVLAKCFDDVPTLANDAYALNERRDAVIQVIELHSLEDRLEIIKLVYEAFYAVYNPQDADRLGIVYTPKAAVDFIIKSTDLLMEKHLKTCLHDKNTHIIDPCVGTGTFMLSLIQHIGTNLNSNSKHLVYKYENELHANEVSILAYYIAAMNIERMFESMSNNAKIFPGIVWRDTLLSLNLDDFPVRGNDNIARMRAQQTRKITVIVGNPPYNVGQKNFGDGNPNPTYFANGSGVDDRISQTYLKHSKFKKQTRDLYKRFVRWASDRIGDKGIVSFISNNSFVHSNNYDGMRKCLSEEFDHIYICDLRGNAYYSGEAWRKEGAKFFGSKSRVGIAIYFFIKTGQKKKNRSAKIHYADVGDYKTRDEKFDWISNTTVTNMKFRSIVPNLDNMWIAPKINLSYRRLVPLISFQTKKGDVENAIFRIFATGIKTAADSWQMDFDINILKKKLHMYIREYDDLRVRYQNILDKSKFDISDYLKNSPIPWYSGFDTKARSGKVMSFSNHRIRSILYRPFLTKYFYYDLVMIQRTSRWPDIVNSNLDSNIPSICVSARSSRQFECVGAYGFVDHSTISNSQNIPLYTIANDNSRISNVTTFGRTLFHRHYENSKITDDDIFYYCYAVLMDPLYIKKYGPETKTLHPHIPLHPNFFDWMSIGKQLFELHADYKKQPRYNLHPVHHHGDQSKFILNLVSSNDGKWKARIDESFSIDGIPAKAANPKAGGYVIGARTPIGWVLEHYQKACKKSPKSSKPSIPVNLDLLDFVSYRDEIIDLVYRLCTVSVNTEALQNHILALPHSFTPCTKSCCSSLLTTKDVLTHSTNTTITKKRSFRTNNTSQQVIL